MVLESVECCWYRTRLVGVSQRGKPAVSSWYRCILSCSCFCMWDSSSCRARASDSNEARTGGGASTGTCVGSAPGTGALVVPGPSPGTCAGTGAESPYPTCLPVREVLEAAGRVEGDDVKVGGAMVDTSLRRGES